MHLHVFSSFSSFPVFHLFGKGTMRAIGIVLQTEVFVDLQERLLVRDCFCEIPPSRTFAKQTRDRGFEPAVGQTSAQLRVFWPNVRILCAPKWKNDIRQNIGDPGFAEDRKSV